QLGEGLGPLAERHLARTGRVRADRDERHAADRAVARLAPSDLRVHRAGEDTRLLVRLVVRLGRLVRRRAAPRDEPADRERDDGRAGEGEEAPEARAGSFTRHRHSLTRPRAPPYARRRARGAPKPRRAPPSLARARAGSRGDRAARGAPRPPSRPALGTRRAPTRTRPRPGAAAPA